MPITAFFAPMAVMCYLFGDPLWMAWHTTLTRWSTSVNVTWLLNSAAHKWGWKPYDKYVNFYYFDFICMLYNVVLNLFYAVPLSFLSGVQLIHNFSEMFMSGSKTNA